MTLGVYKFFVNFGRMGSLEGVFVEDSIRVAAIPGTEVYFGEVLGKHSDVSVEIEPRHITLVSDDPKVVSVVSEHGLANGTNPFSYIDDHFREDILDEAPFESEGRRDDSYLAFHRRVRALRDQPSYTFTTAWSKQDGVFVTRVKEFPSVACHGDTEQEALAAARLVVADIEADVEAEGS